MNELLAFEYDAQPARVVMIDGEPWWVAGDFANILGYRSASDMARNLDDDEKGTHIVRTLGGDQEMTVISESGVFHATFKSRRPEAHRFRKWVTAEVLPSIRRTGKYQLKGYAPPEAPPELALNIDPVSVGVGLQVVRDAKRLFGPEVARQVWIDLGLPQPIVDAEPTINGDPLIGAVKSYLLDKAHVRASEVVHAIGLDENNMRDRRRTIEMMRFAGWMTWSKRVNGVRTKVWLPRSSVEG